MLCWCVVLLQGLEPSLQISLFRLFQRSDVFAEICVLVHEEDLLTTKEESEVLGGAEDVWRCTQQTTDLMIACGKATKACQTSMVVLDNTGELASLLRSSQVDPLTSNNTHMLATTILISQGLDDVDMDEL